MNNKKSTNASNVKTKLTELRDFAIGCLVLAAPIAWWLHEPEWQTQGYATEELYDQAIAGGFETRADFEEARARGVNTLKDWNSYQEKKRVDEAKREIAAKKSEELLKSHVENERKKVEELKSPTWELLEAIPKEVRGFWGDREYCSIQYLDFMNVYSSAATIIGENSMYIMSYQRPQAGSVAERSPAYRDERKLRTIGVIRLQAFRFVATDMSVYILLTSITGPNRYAVQEIYKIGESDIVKLDGFLRDGDRIGVSDYVLERINNAPSSVFTLEGIRRIGIDYQPNYGMKKCALADYADIADEVFYVVTGGTTTLRKITDQFQ